MAILFIKNLFYFSVPEGVFVDITVLQHLTFLSASCLSCNAFVTALQTVRAWFPVAPLRL